MAGRFVPVLTLAALLAACSSNTPPNSTVSPGSPSASTIPADAPRDGRGPGGRGGFGRGDQMLLRGITLSVDQQQRIDTIRTRYRTQMEQMRNGGDRDAMRSQMRPLMEKQQAEIRAVLTPDQQRQFDQNAAEMRTRMEQGGRPGGAPPE
jgi:Spy/CpxP family protein refolding chaperone